MTLRELYDVYDALVYGLDSIVYDKALEIIDREIKLKLLNPVTGKYEGDKRANKS